MIIQDASKKKDCNYGRLLPPLTVARASRTCLFVLSSLLIDLQPAGNEQVVLLVVDIAGQMYGESWMFDGGWRTNFSHLFASSSFLPPSTTPAATTLFLIQNENPTH
jgi:hypothetical protein